MLWRNAQSVAFDVALPFGVLHLESRNCPRDPLEKCGVVKVVSQCFHHFCSGYVSLLACFEQAIGFYDDLLNMHLWKLDSSCSKGKERFGVSRVRPRNGWVDRSESMKRN